MVSRKNYIKTFEPGLTLKNRIETVKTILKEGPGIFDYENKLKQHIPSLERSISRKSTSSESKNEVKSLLIVTKASIKESRKIEFCHSILGKKTEFPIYVSFELLDNYYSITLNKNKKEKRTVSKDIKPQITECAKLFFFKNSLTITHAQLPALRFLFGNQHKTSSHNYFPGLFTKYKEFGSRRFEKFNFDGLNLSQEELKDLRNRQKLLFELYNTYGSFILALHSDRKTVIPVANDIIVGVLFFMHWESGNIITGSAKSNPVLPSLLRIVIESEL